MINISIMYINYVYTYVTVDKSTIDQMTEFLCENYNEYNLVTYNCVHLAIDAWNICVDSSAQFSSFLVFTPNNLANMIEEIPNHYSGNTHLVPPSVWIEHYDGRILQRREINIL